MGPSPAARVREHGGSAMVEQAQRLRRPSWRDPRLGIGVLLVAGSVALGSWAVAQADRTTEVLLAVTPLTPGDRLAEAELRPHAIRPDALTEVYLNGETDLPDDAVATRVVGAGELVPATAVGTAADLDLRPVVVPLTGPVPAGVAKGATVDLWLTAAGTPGTARDTEPLEPSLLAAGLVVADLLEADSLFTASGGAAAQVLVPQSELPDVLAALSGDVSVVLVPVPGATR
mgnify:CR=1 FL=1